MRRFVCIQVWLAIFACGILPSAFGAPTPAKSRSSSPSCKGGECEEPKTSLRERRLGHALASDFLARSTPWAGLQLNNYIDKLGHKLVSTGITDEHFTFQVVYSTRLNARAFPGGYVFLNSGIISVAENEAELASVLAHEIAHLNRRHWRRRRSKRGPFAWARTVGLTPQNNSSVATTCYTRTLTGRRSLSEYQLEQEVEADRLAADYLRRAGYDPTAIVRMLERLAALEARSRDQERSTSSALEIRRRSLEDTLATLPEASTQRRNPSDFHRVRGQVRGYDKVYSKAMRTPLPGESPSPAKLTRRTSRKISSGNF